MLSLAILAGYGLNYIFSIIKNKSPVQNSKENIIFIIVSCLVLFEFLAVPFPMSSAETPLFISSWLLKRMIMQSLRFQG